MSSVFQENFRKVSRVSLECFNYVLFRDFVVAWISSQLPEQKEGLFCSKLILWHVWISLLTLKVRDILLEFFNEISSEKGKCLLSNEIFWHYDSLETKRSCVLYGNQFMNRFPRFWPKHISVNISGLGAKFSKQIFALNCELKPVIWSTMNKNIFLSYKRSVWT